MPRKRFTEWISLTLALVLTMALSSFYAVAQSGNQGTIVVTAQDATGAVIPGATLELVELRSNSVRKAETSDKGTYTFVNLNIGTYRLSVTRAGYQSKIYDEVLVESSATTTLVASLPVGAVTETVRVTGEATPVLQTSSSEIGTVINTTEIDNLPITGRSIAALTQLVAGFNGTYNGLPTPDQGNNIDGGISSSSRGKYSGSTTPAVQARVESFEQVSTVTDGLSLGNGFGQASTQLNFVSRRGSNQYHGRVYDDFRNSGLNANTYANNASGLRRPKLILNDFGASVGGPILRDKLFFFGTFAASRQPGTIIATNNVLTSAAQQGNFSYVGTDKATHTVNVFQLAQNNNPSFPNAVNATIASQQATINKAVNGQGLTNLADPALQLLTYSAPGGINYYFPVGRIDYNMSDKIRMYLSFLYTQETSIGAYPQPFPGAGFSTQNGNYFFRNYQSNYGLDYIISPKVVNQFKFSFLYDYTQFVSGTGKYWESNPVIAWQFTGGNANMSGANPSLPTGQFYPLFSLSDNVTFQHAAHTFNFGFQGYREQDHYYNPPVGFNIEPLGISSGDPIVNAFTISGSNPTMPAASATNQTEAEQLYAVLTGRLQNVNGSYAYNPHTDQYDHGHSGYNLDELAMATGIWFQDSWKAFPTLTLNYGMRWDFTTATHDVSSVYHNATQPNVWGPTAIPDLFKPGTLAGVANPTLALNPNPYLSWFKSPQPQVGLAWNPRMDDDGFLKKLLGQNSTVVRAGFGLRNFTEPYQFFWDEASNYGSFFYQFFNLTANTSGQPGTFAPGSLSLGNALPPFALSPPAFQDTALQSQFTWVGGTSTAVSGMKQDIRQPYSESWNLSIQREIGRARVLEVRYNGNHTVHQWLQLNPNETNIFENGFLTDFQNAQKNLAANGNKSFSDKGLIHTPIIDAAFANTPANFTATQFINYLINGQVGTFANQLAGNNNSTPAYFCALVGTNFAPCAATGGFTGAGAGYPINFFQANPYKPGTGTNWMSDAGYSNYNALQVDLRQATWHGLQGDFNYTWSKSLGLAAASGDYTSSSGALYTLRNLRLSYVPSSFDIRQVTHAYGTYELPFGTGKPFLSNGAAMNRLVGGFSVGTVITYQTGAPFRVTGGFATYNAAADGGVTLNGVTPSQLQAAVGVHRVPGQTTANLIDPKYLSTPTGGTSNYSYIAPNTTPGTIGNILFLHMPTAFTQNLALTKVIPIKERLSFNLQGEFINVWNHPVFGNTFNSLSSSSVQSTSFMRAPVTNTPRAIELRANFLF
jgi:Carboxypeptidase regulatory-like domain